MYVHQPDKTFIHSPWQEEGRGGGGGVERERDHNSSQERGRGGGEASTLTAEGRGRCGGGWRLKTGGGGGGGGRGEYSTDSNEGRGSAPNSGPWTFWVGLGWAGLMGEGGGIKHIKFIKELRCISWQRDASSTSPSSGAPGESPRRSRLGEGGGGCGELQM